MTAKRLPAWWLLVAVALVCLGAAEEPLTEEAEPRSWLLINVVSIAILAGIVVGLGIWAWSVWQKMTARYEEEQRAALDLETSIRSMLAARQNDRPSAPSPPVAQPVAPARGSQRPEPPPPAASAGPEPASQEGSTFEAMQAVEAILNKLRSAGLFASLEGVIYLSDNRSEGKIVRLTDGKAALVMPRMEPPDFMARQLKRFDLCITALGGDSFCVVSSLGAYIADRFSA